jgi:preprotein translocase subunit YajC
MFITPAWAVDQAPPVGGSGDFFVQMLPLIAIGAIMYFLLIRPQQRRLRDHQQMVGAITRGDTIVTAGGLIGKVVKENGEAEVTVELADNVRVRVVRSTIAEVRHKGGAGEEAS